MSSKTKTGHRPLGINLAILLSITYATILFLDSFYLIFILMSHKGSVGDGYLNSIEARGIEFISLIILLAALTLFLGTYLLIAKRNFWVLITPLGLLLFVGTIGEIADALGTASLVSDIIGFLILILAALPIALIALPVTSRNWLKTNQEKVRLEN